MTGTSEALESLVDTTHEQSLQRLHMKLFFLSDLGKPLLHFGQNDSKYITIQGKIKIFDSSFSSVSKTMSCVL